MYSKDYYLIAINPWYRIYLNRRTDETIQIPKEQYEEYITQDNRMGDLKFTTAGEYMETFEHNL